MTPPLRYADDIHAGPAQQFTGNAVAVAARDCSDVLL
jgi:hypothetical protein